MKYMGSKLKFKKYIIPVLLENLKEREIYVEPFVGGGNIIDSIPGKRIGNDNNYYLIELMKNLYRIKDLPDEITKEEYDKVRTSFRTGTHEFPDWYKGAVGFLASYNGRFFDGGYSGTRMTKEGIRNYYLEAKNNLLSQADGLEGVDWICGDYKENCSNYTNALIYCDIPYKGVKQYMTSRNFNYDEFWNWARIMSESNTVIVSEQEAPSDFEVIWEMEVKRNIDYNKKVIAFERLFRRKK